MGIASSLASCAASCCAVCACEACKGVAGGISRKSARLAYCGLFTLSLLLSWALRDFAEPLLEKIPWIDTFEMKPSKEWFGTQAVLRVSFGNFAFFTLLAIIMIGVEDQRDIRDGWHHGGWMMKFIAWAGLIVGAFLLPNSIVEVYGGAARFGSGLFLLCQMVILLDFTYSWNEAWVAKDDQKWYTALLVVSLSCLVAVVGIAAALFYWFTAKGVDCNLNTFFISFALLLVIGFNTLALHPEVMGSLLPGSVIGVYCMYLCWNALSSEPRGYECNGLASHLNAVSGWTLALGMGTTLMSVAYSAVRAGSSTSILSASEGGQPLLALEDGKASRPSNYDSDDDPLPADRENIEDKPVKYIYSFFHLVFALAAMYSAMLLTGWGNVGVEGKDIIDVGWPSVWVKIASLWVTAGLYVWSLLAPLIFPDRDFR